MPLTDNGGYIMGADPFPLSTLRRKLDEQAVALEEATYLRNLADAAHTLVAELTEANERLRVLNEALNAALTEAEANIAALQHALATSAAQYLGAKDE